MSITLKRTVAHVYNDGSESILEVSVLDFGNSKFSSENGRKSILVSRGPSEESIMIHSKSQLDELIRALHSVAEEIF